MKALALSMSIIWSTSVLAATGSSEFLLDVTDDMAQVEEPSAPPVLNPAPVVAEAQAPDPVGPKPKCQVKPPNPNAKNTPVHVYVDQETQIATFTSPDFPKPVRTYVSTGGGLKIPNGELKKDPYCASTPGYEGVITAVRESDFDPETCTPDEIRGGSTVFPVYHTRTFTDKKGQPIPMPKAIRIKGGIFFHEVPPGYRKYLGQNVSGECVRLPPKAAEMLFQQIEKYGGLRVTISAPPRPNPCKRAQYCDENMRQQAIRDIADGRIPRTQYTGSEGVWGEGGVFGGLNCMFKQDKMRPLAQN